MGRARNPGVGTYGRVPVPAYHIYHWCDTSSRSNVALSSIVTITRGVGSNLLALPIISHNR